MTFSWKTHIIKGQRTLLYLQFWVEEENLEAFYFLDIATGDLPALRAALSDDAPTSLDDYGTVIEKGWGIPNGAQLANIEKQYGKLDFSEA